MRWRLLAILVSVAVAPAAPAVELADGKLTVSGSGAWAWLRTDRNLYVGGKPSGNWDTATFDLLLTARPRPELMLTAQAGFDPPSGDEGEHVSLAWVFAEWRFSDLARVRIGKVQQPFGNYGELQFIGTARPFYTLATSVYGPADMSAEGYWGVGVTGEWTAASGFGLQWDAYGGALETSSYEAWHPLETPPTFDKPETEDRFASNLVGGRLTLLTPWEWLLRVSGSHSKIGSGDEERLPFYVIGASLFHRGEVLWVSAEAFQSAEKGQETQRAAYLELAAFLGRHFQVAVRGEVDRVTLPGVGGSPLLRHDEIALGLNYWFDPGFVVKASCHAVRGKRFAEAEDPGTAYPWNEPTERTDLFVVGMQFSF